MTRFLALDVGDRRTGLAVGSTETGIATPREVLDLAILGDERALIERIRQTVKSEKVDAVLVGDPINMDGTVGFRSEKARAFAALLRKSIRQVKVLMVDERLSSCTADEWMERDGLKPARRKERRDAYAAAVILLDHLQTLETSSLSEVDTTGGDQA